MGLFSALVKTAIETVTLPVAIAKDVLTLGNVGAIMEEDKRPYTVQKLEKIKKASEDQ